MSGNSKSLEGLVGCILGFVQVPPPGGPKMTFSMGAGDRQTLSPPASKTLPVTGKSVSILFNQLGELQCIEAARQQGLAMSSFPDQFFKYFNIKSLAILLMLSHSCHFN